MRVRDSGSGFFSFFGGGGQSRSDTFKKGRKVGQKLQGTLLEWVSEDMAWVNIEGHKLLAQINSKPPVGARLLFLIKQLEPHIILKEIFAPSAGGVSGLSLASDFESARTLFENQFKETARELFTVGPQYRLSAFLDLLQSEKKLLATFLDTTNCVSSINAAVDADVKGQLTFLPWLIPQSSRQLGLVAPTSNTDSSLVQTVYECELPAFGLVRFEFLHKELNTSYRVMLQHFAKAKELQRYLASAQSYLTSDSQCLGVTSLPQKYHGGILSAFVFSP